MADRLAHQDPDGRAGADHDDRVLAHRDAAGLQRADDARPDDQLAVVDLDAAHEDLPRRVHPQRHLLGRRDLDRDRGALAGAVLRVPAHGAEACLRNGGTMSNNTAVRDAESVGAAAERVARAPRHRRTSVLGTGVLLLGALYCLTPVAWVVIAATKSPADLFDTLTFAPGG